MTHLTEDVLRASTLARLDSAVRALKSPEGLSAWPRAERDWFVAMLKVAPPEECHLSGSAAESPTHLERLFQPVIREMARDPNRFRDELQWFVRFCRDLAQPDATFTSRDTEKALDMVLRLRRDLIQSRRREAAGTSGHELF